MSEPLAITNTAIILVTVLVSLGAFRNSAWLEKLIFEPQAILGRGEFYRMLSSALIHADGMHLFGNMLTLYFFGSSIEHVYGPGILLTVYLVSIVGGSALSLWLHRNHEYRALGASGGVCGVLFAWILLFPGGKLALLILPIPMPGWVFGIVYLLYSFAGMRHGWGNIGHDAHLGGAMIGLLTAAFLEPQAVAQSPRLFAAILILGSLGFIYLWKNPLVLPRNDQPPAYHPVPPKIGQSGHRPTEDEVNAVLEKVSHSGVQSLTPKERRILERASRRD